MYRKSLMPYLKDTLEKKEDDLIKALKAETSQGPFKVQAMKATMTKSRLRARPISENKPQWKGGKRR
ncbi:MAG: hypothetical protein ACXAEU_23475 [Candidatus Hodarchaeales archaeon]|jgi:hypothetical protein